jgi:hypothetical protein
LKDNKFDAEESLYNASGTAEQREIMQEMTNDPGLETRMIAEGRILKEVFANDSK